MDGHVKQSDKPMFVCAHLITGRLGNELAGSQVLCKCFAAAARKYNCKVLYLLLVSTSP